MYVLVFIVIILNIVFVYKLRIYIFVNWMICIIIVRVIFIILYL